MEGVIRRPQTLELVVFFVVVALSAPLTRLLPLSVDADAEQARERGAQVSELKGEVSGEGKRGLLYTTQGGRRCSEGWRQRCRRNRVETEGSAMSVMLERSWMLTSMFTPSDPFLFSA